MERGNEECEDHATHFFYLTSQLTFFYFFCYILPSRSSEPPCWTLWSEVDTVSPWLRSPKREFPDSTSPPQIRSRGHHIPHTNTCKSPGLIRVKKKKCKKAYRSCYLRERLRV